MKRLVFFILVLISCSKLSADVLFLNEGEEHFGKLEKIASGQILFIEHNGQLATFSTDSVAYILISKFREGDDIHSVASLTDQFLINLIKNAPEAKDFPDADFVTLYRKRSFNIKSDGTIEMTRRIIKKILKENALDEGNVTLYYFFNRESQELLFAHTYASDGKIYHLTDEAISEESLFPSTPEYDLIKKLKFAMKKVDIGSIIDYAHREITSSPITLYPYLIDVIFGEKEPVLHDELTISWPKEIPLNIERMNWVATDTQIIRESLEKTVEKTSITWFFSDSKGFIPEQFMPNISKIFPRLLIAKKESWEEINTTFRQAVASAAPTTDLLKAFLSEIDLEKQPSKLMKAKAIYETILRRIRLLGISQVFLGNFVPISANITLTKKYGNNFARLVLLHFALSEIGIESHFAIGNSSTFDGINPNIPTLGQADEIFLVAYIDGSTNYIWCGSDYVPFGHVPTAYQGTKIGVFFPHRTEFITLPEGGAEKNRFDRQVFVKIHENGDMNVHDLRSYRGPFEFGFRELRALKEQEIQNFAERSAKKIHPQAELLHFSFSDLKDFRAPVFFVMQYRIPAAATKASENILAFQNYWVKYLSSMVSLTTRKFPFEYSKTEETTTNIIFEMPEGFSWVPWKQNFSYETPAVYFNSSWKQTDQLLCYSDRFGVYTRNFMPGDSYKQFRECISIMNKLNNQWIIIEKTNSKAENKNVHPTIDYPQGKQQEPVPMRNQAPEPQG